MTATGALSLGPGNDRLRRNGVDPGTELGARFLTYSGPCRCPDRPAEALEPTFAG